MVTLWEEENRGHLWVGPSFPRAVSSLASSCLPTGLLGFPEGRTWAHSGPSLVSVDTGGLANGSKGEVPPRAGQGGRGRGGGLAKRAGTGLTPLRQAVLLTRTVCCSLALEGGDPEVLQPLTHTLWPSAYQVHWRCPWRPPKGQPQCRGVCAGGSSVPRGLWKGVWQAALGSGPRAQRRRA